MKSYMFLLLLVINCSNKDEPISNKLNNNTMDQSQSNENEDCKVKVKLNYTSGKTAYCSIEILNKTNKPLFFFNRIYYNAQIESANKNNFYKFIESDILVLTKSIIPVPEDMDVEKPIIPCTIRILPHMHFSEEYEIDIPVTYNHPYEDASKVGGDVKATSIWFGYFIGDSNTHLIGKELINKDEIMFFFDPFDYSYQKIIKVTGFGPLPFIIDGH